MIDLVALTQQQNTLLIAILAPFFGLVSPLLLALLVNRNQRKQKELDWARQDEVAERAKEAAEKAQASAELVAEAQVSLDKKTDHVIEEVEKIHGLVNNQMTLAVQRELEATRETLEVMQELVANHRKAGIEPSLELLANLKGREKKVAELEENLRLRKIADELFSVMFHPEKLVIVTDKPEKKEK